MAEHRVRVIIDGSVARRGAADVEQSFGRIKGAARQTMDAMDMLKRAFLGLSAGMMARDVLRIADAYTAVENRLKLVTRSTTELETAHRALFGVAQQTYASFGATADLYARLARSTSELGISQQRLVAVTESVNQAIAISGASAQSAEAALFQLGQGLGAGALRGEELNSVLEQTPRLAQAIADGLGVTIGQLRNLGSEGQLTAERVIGALESQADALEREFGSATRTAANALTQLRNEWERTIATTFEAQQGTEGVTSAIDGLRDTIASSEFQGGLSFIAEQMGSIARATAEVTAAVGEFRAALTADNWLVGAAEALDMSLSLARA